MPQTRISEGVLEDLQTKKIDAAPAAAIAKAPVFENKVQSKVIEQQDDILDLAKKVHKNDPVMIGLIEKLVTEKESKAATKVLCERCKIYERTEESMFCLSCQECEQQQKEFSPNGEQTKQKNLCEKRGGFKWCQPCLAAAVD